MCDYWTARLKLRLLRTRTELWSELSPDNATLKGASPIDTQQKGQKQKRNCSSKAAVEWSESQKHSGRVHTGCVTRLASQGGSRQTHPVRTRPSEPSPVRGVRRCSGNARESTHEAVCPAQKETQTTPCSLTQYTQQTVPPALQHTRLF